MMLLLLLLLLLLLRLSLRPFRRWRFLCRLSSSRFYRRRWTAARQTALKRRRKLPTSPPLPLFGLGTGRGGGVRKRKERRSETGALRRTITRLCSSARRGCLAKCWPRL